jgi:hypothetical protein
MSKLPEHMTKGGPGDRSEPGNVNTEEWWRDVKPEDETELIRQAKSKEIYFCSIPFTQIYSEMGGNYKACCFGALSDTNIEDVPLKEWMENSDYMNQIRTEMLTPGSDLEHVKKTCSRCYTDEEKYGRSRRTNCLKIHTNDEEFSTGILDSALRYRNTGKWVFHERICEIQLKVFGSECNLDCFMCMHHQSTTRYRVAKDGVWENNIFGGQGEVWENKIANVFKDRTAGIVEQIEELAPYTRSIKIIGGEPFVMKKQYEVLQRLIEIGEAQNIILKYQTNLSKTGSGKHNIFNYLPYFKRVAIVASVDGIGDTIEYMRRRCTWNEILENIAICNKYDNIDVDFNGLVSFLSVLRFYEVIDWCKNNPVIDQVNWAMLEKPWQFSTSNLPEKLKQELIPKYEGWPDIQAALRRPAHPAFNIQDVFSYLLKGDKYYEGTKWEKHLFDVFPELEEYYIPAEITEKQEQTFAQWDKELKESEELADANII